MVQVQLNGLIPPDFEGDLPLFDVTAPPATERTFRFPRQDITDARELQASAASEADFFADHGFVLLPHATAVRDWDADVATIYLDEIEQLIRERLLPGRRIEIQQSGRLLRRGRGTSTPQYAGGVHSDGPLTADAFALNVRAFASEQAEAWWRARYERDDVDGFMSIDFWRPTNMSEPLAHMPLALCEPNSLDTADIFPSKMVGIAPKGETSHHLSLRFNPEQRWVYYPSMTNDEVIAFKLNEFRKADGHQPQNVFHTAFADPDAPLDAQHRQSCEHRVGVLLLR